jgi:D-sedoheptulose 7-phosphate isomerase
MTETSIGGELGRLTDEFYATRAEAYQAAVAACVAALRGGGKILALGNGGSAAEAQHFTAELVNKFSRPRPGLRAITLSTDTSVLTSIANDMSYDAVFSRQVETLGDPGDVALALTTSGNSPNILRALRSAREKGMKSIALTGMGGGQISGLPDILLDVASRETPRVQEVHLVIIHTLVADIEAGLGF